MKEMLVLQQSEFNHTYYDVVVKWKNRGGRAFLYLIPSPSVSPRLICKL